MKEKLSEKIGESFSAVLPISAIVLILSTLMAPISIGTVVMFIVGAAFLILGMGLFSLGAEMSMTPIGESVGAKFSKSNLLVLVLAACFFLGAVITIAEPDLQVLAEQVVSIPNNVLILTVAAGVGLFLTLGYIRSRFNLSLSVILIIAYLIVFALSAFTPYNFVAVAFDSGGVTTGPMTVPFILALGVGIASKQKDQIGNSFGFVAISSVGPILAVMLLGIGFNPQNAAYGRVVIAEVETLNDVMRQFIVETPKYFKEVMFAFIPIVGFLVIFEALTRKFKKRQLMRISIGIIYTYLGLVMFLTGVNVGFIPVGSLLGAEIASSGFKWALIPIGALVGYFIVAAEPAIIVLNNQVEHLSGGAIPKKAMNLCLSIGVAVSVSIAMIRILTGISIFWFLIPGYAIALGLSFFVDRTFTGIAFDSGGVASGPMTSTFLLPFVIGACEALGGNVLTDAFGVVAMVAMTPLVAIQILGYIYKDKINNTPEEEKPEWEEFLERR